MKTRIVAAFVVGFMVLVLCPLAYSGPVTYSFKCQDIQDPNKDPNVFGTVEVLKINNSTGATANIFKYPDKCVDDTKVLDAYCIKPNSGTPGGRYLNCKPGEKCESGKCVPPPAASLNDVKDPAWYPPVANLSEFFMCESHYLGFTVKNPTDFNKNVSVVDCSGDGQIDYLQTGQYLQVNSSEGWLPKEEFAKYQPYLDLVLKNTKERLANVVVDFANINYIKTWVMLPSMPPFGGQSGCPNFNTIFYIDFGTSSDVSMSCKYSGGGDCKMFNLALNMNKYDSLNQPMPFVVDGWHELWEALPSGYPPEVVTITDALIEKLPEELKVNCNGEEVEFNFVK